MKKRIGIILLAIYLIVAGVAEFVSFPYQEYIAGGLAIAAGIVILLNRRSLKKSSRLGIILLAITLIAVGLIEFVGLPPMAGTVAAILEIVTGVILLLGI